MDNTARDRALRLLAAALFALGLSYFVKGSYHMFTVAGDFHLRWTEQHYIFRGKDPSEVWTRQNAVTHGLPIPARSLHATIEPDLGTVDGAYPPWAYATLALVAWPSRFLTARVLFGVVNVLALVYLLSWAFRIGNAARGLPGWFLALAVFASASICTTLGLGQTGVLVLAALAATATLAQGGHPWFAGLLLGIALTKVTLAAPFVIALASSRHFKIVTIGCIYIAVVGALVALHVHSDPITMLRGMTAAAEHFADRGYSLISALTAFGMSTRPAMLSAAFGTVAIGSLVLWRLRQETLIVQFAVAAVVSRLWTYHSHYDNLIAIFLLTAIGTQELAQRRLQVAFGLVALSLWAPATACDYMPFRIFQLGAWIACTAVLVSHRLELGRQSPSIAKPAPA